MQSVIDSVRWHRWKEDYSQSHLDSEELNKEGWDQLWYKELEFIIMEPYSQLKTKLCGRRDGSITLEILSQFLKWPSICPSPLFLIIASFSSTLSLGNSLMWVALFQCFPVLPSLVNRQFVSLVTINTTESHCLKGLGWLWEAVSLMTLPNQTI